MQKREKFSWVKGLLSLLVLVCLGAAAFDVVLTIHGVGFVFDPAANVLSRLFAAALVVLVSPSAFAGALAGAFFSFAAWLDA